MDASKPPKEKEASLHWQELVSLKDLKTLPFLGKFHAAVKAQLADGGIFTF
jgi:hypothetical protein